MAKWPKAFLADALPNQQLSINNSYREQVGLIKGAYEDPQCNIANRNQNALSAVNCAAFLNTCDPVLQELAIHQSQISKIPASGNGSTRKTLSTQADHKNVLDTTDMRDFHAYREVNRLEIRQMLDMSLHKNGVLGALLSRKEQAC